MEETCSSGNVGSYNSHTRNIPEDGNSQGNRRETLEFYKDQVSVIKVYC
jgi:hypothetical protein